MPISIKTTKNTRTGIRGVQRYGAMYRWRVDATRFRSLTGQDPTPPFIARLNESKSGCVDSVRFHMIEDAGDDLCRFLKAMTGVSFEYQWSVRLARLMTSAMSEKRKLVIIFTADEGITNIMDVLINGEQVMRVSLILMVFVDVNKTKGLWVAFWPALHVVNPAGFTVSVWWNAVPDAKKTKIENWRPALMAGRQCL